MRDEDQMMSPGDLGLSPGRDREPVRRLGVGRCVCWGNEGPPGQEGLGQEGAELGEIPRS